MDFLTGLSLGSPESELKTDRRIQAGGSESEDDKPFDFYIFITLEQNFLVNFFFFVVVFANESLQIHIDCIYLFIFGLEDCQANQKWLFLIHGHSKSTSIWCF